MMLPALSVKQPWASLIHSGRKWIETREWVTRYRGPLVICSSKLPVGQGPTGVALCVRFLRHCEEMTKAHEAGACCELYRNARSWIFAEDRRIDLNWFKVRGQRGIFPLLVPDGAFFSPEDRLRAYKWLDWAKEKGMLDRIRNGWNHEDHGGQGE
jgi:hypothetical protein